MHYPSSSVFDLAGIGCEVVENRRDVARLCTCGVAIVHQGRLDSVLSAYMSSA